MKEHASDFAPLHKDGIVVKLLDETLVYDKEKTKAYCLNSTAAAVWTLCDGKRTVAEIAAAMTNESKSVVDEGVVWLTLRRLLKAGLLAMQKKHEEILVSRRAVMRKIGIAAVVLPVVTSIFVPPAEAAVSCSTFNQVCNPRPCCPGMGLVCLSHLCV
jgi:hypothetical protein